MQKYISSNPYGYGGTNPLAGVATANLIRMLWENRPLSFEASGRGERAVDENAALELARRAAEDTAIAQEMIRIVTAEAGKPQKLAAWVLIHSTENPISQSFVTEHFSEVNIPYRALNGFTIQDKRGNTFTLRVKEYPGRMVIVTADTAGCELTCEQDWSMGGTNSTTGKTVLRFGQMAASQRTVSYSMYMYGMPNSFVSAQKMTMRELREWLQFVSAFATETITSFQDKGIWKAHTQAWISILPRRTWVMIPLTETRSSEYIYRGGSFFNTPVGKAYRDQFTLREVKIYRGERGGVGFTILLRRR